jgi:hypothetical protein
MRGLRILMVRVAAFLCTLEEFVGTLEHRTTHHRLGKQADKVFGSIEYVL